MNFLSFEYFEAVAEHRSFTRAAKSLSITQQTLSAHISAVERELGVRLLVRTSPLQLTHEGEVFLRHARQMLGQHRAMRHEICADSAEQRGVLKVGVSFARGHALMPRLVEAFQRRYPHVEVRLREGSNSEIVQTIADGGVDVAIARFERKVPGIECVPFYRERMVLVVSHALFQRAFGEEATTALEKTLAGDYAALGCCPFVLGVPDDIGGQVGRDFLEANGIAPEVRAQSENPETLLSLCELGVGACFCTDNVFEGYTQGRATGLVRLDIGQIGEYQIWLATRAAADGRWKLVDDFVSLATGLRR